MCGDGGEFSVLLLLGFLVVLILFGNRTLSRGEEDAG